MSGGIGESVLKAIDFTAMSPSSDLYDDAEGGTEASGSGSEATSRGTAAPTVATGTPAGTSKDADSQSDRRKPLVARGSASA